MTSTQIDESNYGLQSQDSQKKAFEKLTSRIFEGSKLITNCKEFSNFFQNCLELILNGFYFPNQYPNNIPYFKMVHNDQDGCQIICYGQYYLGLKNSTFVYKYRENINESFQNILINQQSENCEYNEQGLKKGRWIKIDKNFSKRCQIIQNGEYNNGQKCNQWNILYRKNQSEEWITIGGGKYDSQGKKQGKWVKLEKKTKFDFYDWEIIYKDVIDKDICFIQSGQSLRTIGMNSLYDDDQFPSKYKKYVNQSFQFCKSKILGFKICQYREGKKQGELDIVYNNMKIGGGKFNQNGFKQGFWKKFYKQITSQIFVIYQGQYNDGQKISKWNYEWVEPLTRNCKIIGGGIYDQNQLKQGEWTDLSNNFKEDFQVILTGYYRNGIKYGQWNSLFRRNQKTRFKKICGGLYNEQGVKQGQWTELTSNFSERCKIIWCGEYKGGNKNGQWFLQQKTIKLEKEQFEKQIENIGGGEYDLNGLKIGNWTELHENYNENCQALNEGQYHNGKKINKWIIKYRYSDGQTFEIIGGGEYDDKGKKQGKWEDLAKNFSDSCQLILFANYQAGIIQGQHMIKLRNFSGSNLQLEDLEIGCLKLGRKEGSWIEVADNFKEYSQILYKGLYNKGIKEGMWQIQFREQSNQKFNEIGGGLYENGRKVQSWIDIDDEFCRNRQLIYNVEYQDGKKINFCEIKYREVQQKEFKIIGKGEYDGNGMKDKEWVQPNENFWSFNQLIDHGQYRNGVKINQWQIIRDTNIIIEQGHYNQDGQKKEVWVEFVDKGYRNFIIRWQGSYVQGKKRGEWNWQIFQKQINSWKSVGNFQYDDEEMKNGICTEVDQNFLLNKLTYIGMYSNGKKVGQFKEEINKF